MHGHTKVKKIYILILSLQFTVFLDFSRRSSHQNFIQVYCLSLSLSVSNIDVIQLLKLHELTSIKQQTIYLYCSRQNNFTSASQLHRQPTTPIRIVDILTLQKTEHQCGYRPDRCMVAPRANLRIVLVFGFMLCGLHFIRLAGSLVLDVYNEHQLSR